MNKKGVDSRLFSGIEFSHLFPDSFSILHFLSSLLVMSYFPFSCLVLLPIPSSLQSLNTENEFLTWQDWKARRISLSLQTVSLSFSFFCLHPVSSYVSFWWWTIISLSLSLFLLLFSCVSLVFTLAFSSSWTHPLSSLPPSCLKLLNASMIHCQPHKPHKNHEAIAV